MGGFRFHGKCFTFRAPQSCCASGFGIVFLVWKMKENSRWEWGNRQKFLPRWDWDPGIVEDGCRGNYPSAGCSWKPGNVIPALPDPCLPSRITWDTQQDPGVPGDPRCSRQGSIPFWILPGVPSVPGRDPFPPGDPGDPDCSRCSWQGSIRSQRSEVFPVFWHSSVLSR